MKMKIDNRGFTLVELMVSTVIISFLVALLLNYSSIQKNAFEYKNANGLIMKTATKEISTIYATTNWSTMTKNETTPEEINIIYENYSKTIDKTEKINLKLWYKGKSWSFELERMDPNE